MSKRKFYRTVFQYEVLSEEPLPDCMTLEQISYETMEGHCSGMFLETTKQEVTARSMVTLLLAQGSDPEFFGLQE